MVHCGEHVIMGQSLPAHGHHRHRGLHSVKDAGVGLAVVSAGVGVLLLSDHPEQGGVGVGQGTNAPQTATSAATVQRVKGTTEIELTNMYNSLVGFLL